ncbi:MAG: hypothetical protein HC890_12615 [Chloroflexaceae bacterium]|nr:hypothetical protein [Chloroflexaceae bacterium]
MSPIQEARAVYREWTDAALREAIASTAQLALATGGTIVLGLGTAAYWDAAKYPSKVFAATGLVATAATACYAAYKWIDCPADWQTWKHLNSGENRAHLAATMATAQADQIKQLVLSWQPQRQECFSPVSPESITVTSLPLSTDNLALSLGRNLSSALVVGQPGAGKGLAIAHAIRHAKIHHPDLKIWVIDPKADPQEQTYWEPCDRILAHPLAAFSTAVEINHFCLAVDAMIAEFREVTGPKLLILDEALGVKELAPKWFKGLMAGFNYLCSTGRSRQCYGWIISQTPNADDFGISGGARNVYRRILMLHQQNLGLVANNSTFFNGRPSDELLQLTGRVFYDSLTDLWGAVPVYPVPQATGGSASRKSRRDSLESAWSIPALSPAAATVLEYLQRREQRHSLDDGNAPPIDVVDLAHNLTAKPYQLSRPVCREAIAELATARLAVLRDGGVSLRAISQGE